MLTVELPESLAGPVRAAVEAGRFPSVDEAIAEAVRLLLADLNRWPADASTPRSSLLDGSMSDEDAALLDEIVADIYQRRRNCEW